MSWIVAALIAGTFSSSAVTVRPCAGRGGSS